MIIKQGAVKRKSRVDPTKTVQVPQSGTYNASNVLQGSLFGGGPLVTFEGNESISYTTKRKSQRHSSNTCDHQRYNRYYSGNAQAVYKVRAAAPHNADGWYLNYYGGHTDGPHALAEVAALAAVGASIALDYPGDPRADLEANFYELRPDLTTMSLPNFLLELDDVQKLWLQFKANLSQYRRFVRATDRHGSTAKTLAGDHLAWSFGVKPLFGDLSAMADIIKTLMQKLKAFDDLAGEIMSRRKVIKSQVITKTGTFSYLGNSQIPVFWTCVYELKKTVGFTYRCDPRAVTGQYTTILAALLDALGFELNPRIIWDALPFTFVLDWFFDVGSWLGRHKYDTLELPITYIDSYVQCVQDVTINSYFTQNKDDLTSDSGRRVWPAWVTHKRRFIRSPIAPSESAFAGLGWHLPSPNQAKLLFSLGTVLAPVNRI